MSSTKKKPKVRPVELKRFYFRDECASLLTVPGEYEKECMLSPIDFFHVIRSFKGNIFIVEVGIFQYELFISPSGRKATITRRKLYKEKTEDDQSENRIIFSR